EEEGLIEAIPSGGFAVKAFTEADIFDAIEVRGAMEGLVARAAAERGVSRSSLAAIKDCLAEIDELIGSVDLTLDHFSDYVRLNARFHALLHELSGSPVMIRQAERAGALPFASPSGFVIAQSALPQARTILIVAQDQHRCVVEAIETREGERADAIMREHARLARRNLQLALENQSTLDLVAGSSLIRRGGRG
ncbi:MAG: GntR family transcriptional regulator, partial [Beijerinckiaceae bacterium]|nr:GntR family transcriptional regulator [Beijerinckiaceae bacterium]